MASNFSFGLTMASSGKPRTRDYASGRTTLDAAKAIDKKVPASAPVVIQTPTGVPDIVIPAEKA